MQLQEFLILLVIGLCAGFLSGAVGVGGGIVVVPALVYFLGLNQQQAQGTSLMMLSFPIGIVAALQYFKSPHMNGDYKYWYMAGAILLTFFIGSYFGSKAALKIDRLLMQRLFGVFVFLVSLKMIFSK